MADGRSIASHMQAVRLSPTASSYYGAIQPQAFITAQTTQAVSQPRLRGRAAQRHPKHFSQRASSAELPHRATNGNFKLGRFFELRAARGALPDAPALSTRVRSLPPRFGRNNWEILMGFTSMMENNNEIMKTLRNIGKLQRRGIVSDAEGLLLQQEFLRTFDMDIRRIVGFARGIVEPPMYKPLISYLAKRGMREMPDAESDDENELGGRHPPLEDPSEDMRQPMQYPQHYVENAQYVPPAAFNASPQAYDGPRALYPAPPYQDFSTPHGSPFHRVPQQPTRQHNTLHPDSPVEDPSEVRDYPRPLQRTHQRVRDSRENPIPSNAFASSESHGHHQMRALHHSEPPILHTTHHISHEEAYGLSHEGPPRFSHPAAYEPSADSASAARETVRGRTLYPNSHTHYNTSRHSPRDVPFQEVYRMPYEEGRGHAHHVPFQFAPQPSAPRSASVSPKPPMPSMPYAPYVPYGPHMSLRPHYAAHEVAHSGSHAVYAHDPGCAMAYGEGAFPGAYWAPHLPTRRSISPRSGPFMHDIAHTAGHDSRQDAARYAAYASAAHAPRGFFPHTGLQEPLYAVAEHSSIGRSEHERPPYFAAPEPRTSGGRPAPSRSGRHLVTANLEPGHYLRMGTQPIPPTDRFLSPPTGAPWQPVRVPRSDRAESYLPGSYVDGVEVARPVHRFVDSSPPAPPPHNEPRSSSQSYEQWHRSPPSATTASFASAFPAAEYMRDNVAGVTPDASAWPSHPQPRIRPRVVLPCIYMSNGVSSAQYPSTTAAEVERQPSPRFAQQDKKSRPRPETGGSYATAPLGEPEAFASLLTGTAAAEDVTDTRPLADGVARVLPTPSTSVDFSESHLTLVPSPPLAQRPAHIGRGRRGVTSSAPTQPSTESMTVGCVKLKQTVYGIDEESNRKAQLQSTGQILSNDSSRLAGVGRTTSRRSPVRSPTCEAVGAPTERIPARPSTLARSATAAAASNRSDGRTSPRFAEGPTSPCELRRHDSTGKPCPKKLRSEPVPTEEGEEARS